MEPVERLDLAAVRVNMPVISKPDTEIIVVAIDFRDVEMAGVPGYDHVDVAAVRRQGTPEQSGERHVRGEAAVRVELLDEGPTRSISTYRAGPDIGPVGANGHPVGPERANGTAAVRKVNGVIRDRGDFISLR